MIKKITLFCFLIVLQVAQVFAQHLEYDRTSPWFIGTNFGATWQSTDVRNKTNHGWGLVLGRTFNRNPGSILSFDLKLRYLGGAWRGQDKSLTSLTDYEGVLSSGNTDYKSQFGFSLNNFQTKSHELNLELSLHLNRFTERTSWDPYIFGGVGTSLYRSRGNLLDDNEVMYDLNNLTQFNSTTISNFLNKNYETNLISSVDRIEGRFMGHLGFGLGYYPARNFAIGLEHKTTFTGVDNFDGYVSSNPRKRNDLYHYTSVYLKIYFNRVDRTRSNPTTDNSNPTVQPPVAPPTADCPVPLLQIYSATNSTVSTPTFTIQGNVKNHSQRNVTVEMNGYKVGDATLKSNNDFQYNASLQNGQNTIVLSIETQCGRDVKTIYVNYAPECEKPVVTVTNPRTLRTTSAVQNVSYAATVSDLGNGLVQVYINGQESKLFSYNTATGQLSGNTNLIEGQNTVQIIATNNCGASTQTIYYDYSRSCPPPSIQLYTANNSTVSTPYFIVEGSAYNRSNYTIYGQINGTNAGNFSYKTNNDFQYTTNLQNGLNTIVLILETECGRDQKTIYVNYVPACDQPTVTFTQPRSIQNSTNESTVSFAAAIGNLGSGVVQVYINGKETKQFNYSAATGNLNGNAFLQEGHNTIQIIATNNCGASTQTIYYDYNKVCPTPLLSTNQQTSQLVNDARFDLKVVMYNITNANQVDVFQNGTLLSDGTFNASTKTFAKSITLVEGINNIVIRATNGCGTADLMYTIDYVLPCIAPKVTFTVPSGPRSTTSDEMYTFQATIANVINPQDIRFEINGERIYNYNFSPTSGFFTAQVKLQQGGNVITLTANNQCGTGTASATVTYNPPCVSPTLVIELPTDRMMVKTSTIDVVAQIANIYSVNDVTVLVNGIQQQTAVYDGATKKLKANVKLSKGENKIQIIVNNGCGSVEKAVTINYLQLSEVQIKPVIAFNNNCDVTIAPGVFTFTGKVDFVQEFSQVQIKLNGVTQSDVAMQKTATGITFSLPVAIEYEQTKVVEVIATNQGGTVTMKCEVHGDKKPVVEKEIQICHKVNGVSQTITILESEWPKYKLLGASLGQCVVMEQMMVICLIDASGVSTTMRIKESEWPYYQKMGATKGACQQVVDNDIVICVSENGKKVTKTIKESQWDTYKAKGATLGQCPEVVDNDIIICAYQGRVRVNMTIKESEWPKYQAQGATLGECPVYDPEITICLRDGANLNTLVIKESEWPKYQAMGAFIGECPQIVDNDIVICVPADNGKNVTLTIKQSLWAEYQKKGATLGACQNTSTSSSTNANGQQAGGSVDKMLICVKENGQYVTKTILSTQWKQYETLGAVKGACNESATGTAQPISPKQEGTIKPQIGVKGSTSTSIPKTTTTPRSNSKVVVPSTTPTKSTTPAKTTAPARSSSEGTSTEGSTRTTTTPVRRPVGQ